MTIRTPVAVRGQQFKSGCSLQVLELLTTPLPRHTLFPMGSGCKSLIFYLRHSTVLPHLLLQWSQTNFPHIVSWSQTELRTSGVVSFLSHSEYILLLCTWNSPFIFKLCSFKLHLFFKIWLSVWILLYMNHPTGPVFLNTYLAFKILAFWFSI